MQSQILLEDDAMTESRTASRSLNVTLRLKEFAVPPISDGLVLGKICPIGATAMRKALSLLQNSTFDHFKVKDDDVVGDIFVRSSILKRVSRKQILQLVLDRVKPLMSENEIMHLNIEAELVLEEQL